MTISHVKLIFIGTGALLLLLLVVVVFFMLGSEDQERDLVAPTDVQQDDFLISDEQLPGSGIEKKIIDPKPGDKDRDGLSDVQEQEIGTDEKQYDTDLDGISDGDEINIYGTDPLDRDTDGDGFSDGVEIRNGYNPNGDGLLNDNQ